MSFSVSTICRRSTWRGPRAVFRLAGVELCGNCFTLYFFPENGDGRFRLLTTQSFSLFSCLTVKWLLIKMFYHCVLFSSSFPCHSLLKNRVQPHLILSAYRLCCIVPNRGLLFCLQGELPALENYRW